MDLSAQDELELGERFQWNGCQLSVAKTFCEEKGYDLFDEDVLNNILEIAYQNGYENGERDMMESVDAGNEW